VYKNNHSKVTIICQKHGYFEQTPHGHLAKQGCPKCSVERIANALRLSQKEFIKRASNIHQGKYDYSKTVYVRNIEKITIICPHHGEFQQLAGSHLSGNGCWKCVVTYPLSKEQFIQVAIEKHGDQYDYSKIEYVNTTTHVTIICSTHGEFTRTPSVHLSSDYGCPKCGVEARAAAATYSTEEFIVKAKKVHGNKYCYNKTKYIKCDKPVIITCVKHGDYKQKPVNHINSRGCPQCANNVKLTTADFIQKSQEVHGNKYDYSQSIYKGGKEKIEIICSVHGSFWQNPNHHMRGVGCPKCNESNGEKSIREYLERHNIKYKPQYKFKKSEIYRSRFDFAIQNGLIEYHGKQHYLPSSFGSSEKNADIRVLVDTVQRDFKKERWCKKYKIPLLIIPYWDKKRIPEILDVFFTGKEPALSNPPQIVIKYETIRQKILQSFKCNL